jgi:osmoprotectant transport system permease protein
MDDGSWTAFVADRWPELWLRIAQHLALTGISTGLAMVIGIPLGAAGARVAWLRGPILAVVGVLQTIPSLAILTLLLALLHKIGAVPAIIALTLYALLPMVRNTMTGLAGVSPELLEAAEGIGMTRRQQLWLVRFPLALPVIVAGVRTAGVAGVGIATLSAFIGAGGLGQFINRGLALADTRLILLGAIPAAALALLVDLAIGAAGWALDPQQRARRRSGWQALLRSTALALPLLLFGTGIVGYVRIQPDITVASKNFTEQLLLGHLMATLIEDRTGLRVDRRFCLGGTMICHGALDKGEVDLYAEYTGTGLTAVLGCPPASDPDRVWHTVRREYRQRFGALWLPPFGMNNTYAITVRDEDARRHGWETISDLREQAAGLRAGFTAEFAERPDGYPGFREAYGLRFGAVLDIDSGLMYEAMASGEVDVIAAFATDGRIAAFGLKPLRDDRGFFPPYYAAPVARLETLRRYPAVQAALEALAGVLDDRTMQQLNYQVDHHQRNARTVANEFLVSRGLLGS